MAQRPDPGPRPVNTPDKGDETPAFSLVGKRAIVVEDEGITQLQLRRILRSAGVEVIGVAGTGHDAIDIVLKTKPDVVLMDVRLPVMDGLQASRRILEQLRVCIVMLTAFSDEEYQQEARDMGACGYILKPVTRETLIPQLTMALKKFTQK